MCNSTFAGKYFNSRPRVGGVVGTYYSNLQSGNFNSRPRVGGVCYGCRLEGPTKYISILAPAWGASVYKLREHLRC